MKNSLKDKSEEMKFYEKERAELLLQYYPGCNIFDGNNDSNGQPYWQIGRIIGGYYYECLRENGKIF